MWYPFIEVDDALWRRRYCRQWLWDNLTCRPKSTMIIDNRIPVHSPSIINTARMSLSHASSDFLAVATESCLSIFASYNSDYSTTVAPVIDAEIPLNNGVADLNWFPFDNGLIASSHRNRRIYFWATESMKLAEIIEIPFPIYCHSFCPVPSSFQTNVAVGGRDGVCLVDLRSGESSQRLRQSGLVRSILWDQSCPCKLLYNTENSLWSCDIRKADHHEQIIKETGSLVQLKWLSNSRLVTVASSGKILLLYPALKSIDWSTELEFECLNNFSFDVVEDTIHSMALLPAGEEIHAVRLTDGIIHAKIPVSDPACADAIVYDKDNMQLIIMSLDHLKCWNLKIF